MDVKRNSLDVISFLRMEDFLRVSLGTTVVSRNFDFRTLNFHARLRQRRSTWRKFIRENGKLRAGHLERIERKVPPTKLPSRSRQWTKETEKRNRTSSLKKSLRRFTRAAGKLGGKASFEDREIEFLGEISLPAPSFPFPPLSLRRNSRLHLFIPWKGCASTYAIEMKFLINK